MWISHSDPEQSWENHVSGVVRLNRIFLEGLAAQPFDCHLMRPLSSLTAVFHDLAKTTKYFQEYIRSDEAKKSKLKGTPLYRHTFLSAICCYYAVQAMYERHHIHDSFDPLIAYIVVRRHHAPLQSILYECEEDADLEPLMQQTEALPWAEVKQALLRLLDEEVVELSGLDQLPLHEKQVKSWVDEFPRRLRKYRRTILKNSGMFGGMDLYLKTQLLFSLLIDSDKSQVGIGNESLFITRHDLDAQCVARHVAKLTSGSAGRIDDLRKQAWQEVLSAPISEDRKIYMLNLPTGMGKTLNAFHYALKLREDCVVKSNGKIRPRIIYALPFLSVIDQNAKVYENVLFTCGAAADSSILLKHHHLSEMKYELQRGESDEMQFDRQAAQLLIEGWNSEVILTTFVQLFHTLIGNKNSSIRKFHRLTHSIILIDEIQSMPVKYWPAIRELLKSLTHWLDCRIVLLTATDPKIFHEDETIYLCDRTLYFQSLDRLTLYADLETPLTIEELASRVEMDASKSYLFIVNTIPCAVELYRRLAERFPDMKMTFLSTHVLPHERLDRIRRIQNNEFQIVVSTQLVEAGVDIDFDVVYRDWAPLDSIYQSAGRCNRHGNRKGTVHVVRLVREENGRAYAPQIYGGTEDEPDNRLEITRQLLKERPMMSEKEFLHTIELYFEQVKAGRTFQTSEKLLRAMRELVYTGERDQDSRFTEYFPLEHFRLIEEDQPKTDVFFVQDERAEHLWETYLDIQQSQNPLDRYMRFMEIKSDFYQYVISLPARMKNTPPLVEGMYVVPKLQINDYYDPVTGYRNEDVTVIF